MTPRDNSNSRKPRLTLGETALGQTRERASVRLLSGGGRALKALGWASAMGRALQAWRSQAAPHGPWRPADRPARLSQDRLTATDGPGAGMGGAFQVFRADPAASAPARRALSDGP